jgi:hypothetical protein
MARLTGIAPWRKANLTARFNMASRRDRPPSV